jgi:formate hydrogenlyase subunit 4
MNILLYFINPILICAIAPLCISIIRILKARMQNRRGPRLLQPYWDIAKLFHKDEVISEDASWIFLSAPYIVFGTTLAIATGLPIIGTLFVADPMSDVLVYIYSIALGTFFLALSGIDVGGGFGGFGASREMFVASLAEGGLLTSLAAIAFLSGTMHIAGMGALLAHSGSGDIVPMTLAACGFFIALLAENARFPVDNPATHLELTMIHEAMILEYSGKRLALMEWAAANKLLIFAILFSNVFIPWGVPTDASAYALALGGGILIAKLLGVFGAIALIESTMAKFRIFRVPDLLFTSFIISLIAFALIAF